MDKPQWAQEILLKPMEKILVPNTTTSSNTNSNSNNNNSILSKTSSSSTSFERRIRPQKAAAVNCPRCDSTSTKFCYYNNYSLLQPRYFCKTCRRYWTEGGTLRNIPVGGGSRKNKRSSSYSSVSKTLPDLVVPSISTSMLSQNPRIHHDQYGQDLNLGFSSTNGFKNVPQFLQVPNFDANQNTTNNTSRGATTSSFMSIPIPIPDTNSIYDTPSRQLMIPMQEFKIPSAHTFLDVMGSNGGRLFFPFEEMKPNKSAGDNDDHTHVGQDINDQNCDSNGLWNGTMGGGSW